jgi:CD109 antigen
MLQEDLSPINIEVDEAINNGLNCVFNELNVTDSDDLYSMSLANYAANLAKQDDYETQHDELRSALDAKANKTIPGALFWDATSKNDNDNRRWWYYYPRSYTVEVTAYNIMSLVAENRTDEAVNAVKWLARHRNSQGGFSSTQDTVVGLQALSVYGTIIGGYSTDMQLGVNKDGAEFEKLSLSEDNKQVLETTKLSGTPPHDVSFNLQGSGCVILQTSLRYNIPESKSAPAFKITHMFKEDVLEVCTSYIGNKEETEMAIMEVEMLSGYSAKNPEDLLNEVEQDVKRVEVNEKENIVVLYFDKLDKQERCV